MARFLTRVELHGAKHGDNSYDTLHAELAKRGFVRTIPTSDRIRTLPTAEYYCAGEFDAGKVFDAAKTAANATGKTSMVLAVEMGVFVTDCPVA